MKINPDKTVLKGKEMSVVIGQESPEEGWYIKALDIENGGYTRTKTTKKALLTMAQDIINFVNLLESKDKTLTIYVDCPKCKAKWMMRLEYPEVRSGAKRFYICDCGKENKLPLTGVELLSSKRVDSK